ncbi:MAG: protein kinase domain-containing protein, partial [Gemmataceae bacterium]
MPDEQYLETQTGAPAVPVSVIGPATPSQDDANIPTIAGSPFAPMLWPKLAGFVEEGILGRGGMGVVFRAHQISLHRSVAVKLIPDGVTASPVRLERFRQEAETVARLQHPNIVQIFEVGEYVGGAYLVLELVDGGTLTS